MRITGNKKTQASEIVDTEKPGMDEASLLGEDPDVSGLRGHGVAGCDAGQGVSRDAAFALFNAEGFLTRSSILAALQEISEKMTQAGEHGKILILGGAAMVLVYRNREGTKDIDAILEPKSLISQIAARMAEEHSLPDGWLNDGVKGFVPDARHCRYTSVGVPQYPSLTIFVPEPEMLFAMKALATRTEMIPGEHGHRDLDDLAALAGVLGVRSEADAAKVIEAFYPLERVPLRFWYSLNDILGKEQS